MPEFISQMYIKINGRFVSSEVMNSVESIEVDDNLLLPDMFCIQLSDPDFEWADSDNFELGKKVEISVGSDSSTTVLLTGEITAIEPEFNRGEIPGLVVRGYDESHRLHRAKQTKTYNQQSDSDIVKKVARECGLKADVETTRGVHDYVCQDNLTDMEFLQNRAERIGFRMYVEDGTLYFRQAPQSEPSVPELEWGENLIEFQARLTTAQQVTEVAVRGWDPKTKKEIIGQATSPQDTPQVGQQGNGGQVAKRAFNLESKEIVVDRPVATQAEADALAQSKCDEIGNSFIQIEGTCWGDPAVHAGAMVEIKGVGQRFSGRYRITNAIHRYDDTGYTTSFTVSGRRNNTLNQLLAAPAEHKNGVMIGLVSNNNDPEGWGRVKVKFPTQPENEESFWARLVSPMAGEGRGFEFIPEVNDEVLVAFEHGDINRPFVLGAMWNGKDKPPEGSDKVVNSTGKVDKRIIHSRSGHTIVLDDTDNDEKISITDKTKENAIDIESKTNTLNVKAGSKVEVKTGNGHTITLSDSGVSIEAAAGQDLTLKANNIKIEADMGLEMKAKAGDAKMEGLNTTVKGSASMTLDGGATLTAKGGMVMIN